MLYCCSYYFSICKFNEKPYTKFFPLFELTRLIYHDCGASAFFANLVMGIRRIKGATLLFTHQHHSRFKTPHIGNFIWRLLLRDFFFYFCPKFVFRFQCLSLSSVPFRSFHQQITLMPRPNVRLTYARPIFIGPIYYDDLGSER